MIGFDAAALWASGLVGASGSIGAVLWGLILLFRGSMATQDCLAVVSLIVIVSSLLTSSILVKDQPGLFSSPHFVNTPRTDEYRGRGEEAGGGSSSSWPLVRWNALVPGGIVTKRSIVTKRALPTLLQPHDP